MKIEWILIGALAISAFDFYVFWKVFTSEVSTETEKIWQTLLVFIVPLLGASVVFFLLKRNQLPKS